MGLDLGLGWRCTKQAASEGQMSITGPNEGGLAAYILPPQGAALISLALLLLCGPASRPIYYHCAGLHAADRDPRSRGHVPSWVASDGHILGRCLSSPASLFPSAAKRARNVTH
jgi:hypothetical protein